MTRFYSFTAALLLLGTTVFAQPGPRRGPGRGLGGPGGPGDFAFLRGEFGFTGKVVTGAPYSAQSVSEFTQTLGDGTHIQRSSTTSVARDSQGRTRTEETMGAIGPLGGSGNTPHKLIFIHDPVAGVSYVLDPSASTVRKTQIASRGDRPGRPAPPSSGNAPAVKTEDLGTQTVEGVSAQGKRVTRTIAAGQMGNDRALEIVTETWFSPDLQVVVMSKTSDPRFGVNSYRLSGISRAEPDPSLFTVPAGYTVLEGRGRGPRPPQ